MAPESCCCGPGGVTLGLGGACVVVPSLYQGLGAPGTVACFTSVCACKGPEVCVVLVSAL